MTKGGDKIKPRGKDKRSKQQCPCQTKSNINGSTAPLAATCPEHIAMFSISPFRDPVVEDAES